MAGRPVVQDVHAWADELGRVGERIGPRFKRSEPRRRALGYIRGLLGDAERKNGWQLAERLGKTTPNGVQHLLARADWDAKAVRDNLTPYAAENLGHADGVLVVDETVSSRRATNRSAWPGSTRGGGGSELPDRRIPRLRTPRGRALLDRELYLPKGWTRTSSGAGRRASRGGSGSPPKWRWPGE